MTESDSADRQHAILAAATALARRYGAEDPHSRQVTLLALRLFDELAPQHRLGPHQRFLLECAALLHDIGLSAGAEGHHKASYQLIWRDNTIPFVGTERRIVGCVARYHRKVLPGDHHEPFGELDSPDQQIVRVLGGILRIADGLDRTHAAIVSDVACDVSAEELIVRCTVRGPAEAELAAAMEKADLMEDVMGRKVRLVAVEEAGEGE